MARQDVVFVRQCTSNKNIRIKKKIGNWIKVDGYQGMAPIVPIDISEPVGDEANASISRAFQF